MGFHKSKVTKEMGTPAAAPPLRGGALHTGPKIKSEAKLLL